MSDASQDRPSMVEVLRSVDLRPCLKIHEDPKTGKPPYKGCSDHPTNAACGHLRSSTGAGPKLLLASLLARSRGLIDEEGHRAIKAELDDIFSRLSDVDTAADVYYESTHTGASTGLSLDDIASREMALGQRTLAIRDKLLGLLEQ